MTETSKAKELDAKSDESACSIPTYNVPVLIYIDQEGTDSVIEVAGRRYAITHDGGTTLHLKNAEDSFGGIICLSLFEKVVDIMQSYREHLGDIPDDVWSDNVESDVLDSFYENVY